MCDPVLDMDFPVMLGGRDGMVSISSSYFGGFVIGSQFGIRSRVK